MAVFYAKDNTAIDVAEVEAIIDNYVDNNPGRIFERVNQHIQEQQQRDETERLEAGFNNPVEVPIADHTAVKGPADAPITIVEFSEFECPFCKRVYPTLQQLYDDYEGQIRWAYRHNPLPFHEQAIPAAQAAQAALMQDKFWEFHDELYQNQDSLGEKLYVEIAEKLGLDVEQFNADRNSEEVAAQVEADLQTAQEIGAQGTPYVVVGGVPVSGAQPYQNFAAIVDRLLSQE